MVTRLAFLATKNNSVEIAYILAIKIYDGFVEYLFPENLHGNLPVVPAKQLGRSMKKTISCKEATELPG